MKAACSSWICRAVRFGALMALVSLALYAGPQQQGPPKTDDRISGKVQKIDKEGRTITLQLRRNLLRVIVYTASTTFTFRNKTSSLDEVKNGRTMTCLGAFNDKGQFAARSCTVQ